MDHDGPDITVDAGGRRLLAVEVKTSGDVGRASDQLAAYMARLLYPVGMVVVARELAVLRRDFAIGEIVTVGTFRTDDVEGLEPPSGSAVPAAGAIFAARVQRWLDSLRDPTVVSQLPDALRQAAADWIVPAVEEGDIRATGPRPRAARAG